MSLLELFFVFSVGAGLYSGIELLWRGRTHWSMLICGGLCFLLMYLIGGTALTLWLRCIICALVISAVEFITGCLVNLLLGWQVWDYSDRAFNILGQVCPLYSFYWLLLTVPGLFLCGGLRRLLG